MDLQTSAPRISNGQLWFSFFSYYDDVGFQFTATWKITESTRAQAMSEDIFTNRLLLQFRWRKKTTTKRFKFWKSNTTAIKIKIKYLGRIWRKEGRKRLVAAMLPVLIYHVYNEMQTDVYFFAVGEFNGVYLQDGSLRHLPENLWMRSRQNSIRNSSEGK